MKHDIREEDESASGDLGGREKDYGC